MKHALEEQKFFPIIAWATVIGFAVFTYTLADKLRKDAEDIFVHASLTEQALEKTN